MQSIEPLLGTDQGRIDYDVPYESSDEEYSNVQEEDIDPRGKAFRKLGYLPPLDEETAAIIDAFIDDPTIAMEFMRINPTSDMFHHGLECRNVFLEESTTPDLYADINHLAQYPLQETDAERESYERLWTLDRAKCDFDWNEALFQRTLMMSFIARHSLIDGQGPAGPSCLEFSVETPWTCPPMPTIAYYLSDKFLTQPKPDLAVCFKRDTVIPDGVYCCMPYATQRLACYETPDSRGRSRAFHFFTIQGRRENTLGRRDNERMAGYQNLNNASQALHNMFEFFQDAGPRHRDKFFSEVRFFSAVASTEGLTVRIHRAIDLSENRSEDDIYIPGYPLRFEFRELVTVEENKFNRKKFDRKTVLELFGKMLVGYGVEKLHGLLQDAAKDLWEKLKKDIKGLRLREDVDFYRHGQSRNTQGNLRELTLKENAELYGHRQVSKTPGSIKIASLAASRGHSVQSPASADEERSVMLPGSANMAAPMLNQSFDMLRGRTTTPTQSQAPQSTQVSNSSAKRCRNQSEDGNPLRETKRLRQ